MEKVKLDNKRILFNLLPAHVAQHFLMSNPRNMVRVWGGWGGPSSDVPLARCASLFYLAALRKQACSRRGGARSRRRCESVEETPSFFLPPGEVMKTHIL